MFLLQKVHNVRMLLLPFLTLLPWFSNSLVIVPQLVQHRAPSSISLFHRNSHDDINATAASENPSPDESKSSSQDDFDFESLNDHDDIEEISIIKNTSNGESEDECLLLDPDERAAVLAQRQSVPKEKETKNSIIRGWINSLVSFLVVIGVGFIGTLWEATSPVYLERAPCPPPRMARFDDPLDADLPDLRESNPEFESLKSRERRIATRQVDSNRVLAISYVKEAVQKVSPSVLRIDTETHVNEADGERLSPGWLQEGQGSGVIFASQGLVLTNAHVVDETTRVTVTLADGRVFRAEVIGSDEVTDIAVIKILTDGETIENFPVAEFGDSDDLEVGQFVVALGSPGGLDMTATMGIVSGLRRSPSDVGVTHKKVDYIQTDAALNPGNSGGPLVDVESGSVIGINACIRSNMEGTSFSIPINKVQEIIADLSVGKPVHHSYIGAAMADCTPAWARQVNANNELGWKFPEVYGALVSTVFPDSPAGAGGLQMNDVIIEIGGTRITSSEDASRCVDQAPVGKDLIVTAIRDGSPVDVRIRPVDLATRLRAMRADRQKQKRRPLKLLEEMLPLSAARDQYRVRLVADINSN